MPTIAEYLIDRLAAHGVRHVFNVPGDYSLSFCRRLEQSKLALIGTTTEENAGFAADAYARVNGIGCVCVTYCVGGFKILNPVGGAFAEKSPVIVISGSPGLRERNSDVLLHHMVRSFECQHEVFSNVTCATTVLKDASTAAYEINRVIAAALQFKQPVYIELPRDMVDVAIPDAAVAEVPKVTSDRENLREVLGEVAGWISSAENPVIWAGVELARHGLGTKVLQFAENNDIPIATDILGKSVIDETHPLCLGIYSESTSRPEVIEFFEKSDCVIMLGVMMTDMNLGFLPLRCRRRNTINASSRSLQVRNHTFDNIRFDDFVSGMCNLRVGRRTSPVKVPPPVYREKYVAQDDTQITAGRFIEKINALLDENMAVVADVGDSLFGALDITVHGHTKFLAPAFYTSMGFAVPGALGVQLANPKVRPIVLVGDGAFQMTGMEFSTMVRLKLNPIVFVLNNNGYGTERVLMDGAFNDIQPWAFDKLPEFVGGGKGYRVTTEGELESAVADALTLAMPAIINVVVPPNDYTPALTRMFDRLSKIV